MENNKDIKSDGFASSPHIENDEARVAALLSYQILDTPETESFDDLTKLAAIICKTPIATVTMVDKFRQWFKSYIGLSDRESPREYSFCAHAIANKDDIYIVTDAPRDKRFADNPLVKGEPNIVFYAGVPLIDKNGFSLGTLCVIDRETRTLTDEQQSSLKMLAKQVMERLEFRRNLLQLSASKDEVQKSKDRFEIALSAGKLGSYDADLSTGLMTCTEQCKKNYGRDKDDVFNMSDLMECILPEYYPIVRDKIDEALANDTVYQADYPIRWPDGSLHWVSVQGKPVPSGFSGKKHIVGVTVDITQRKLEEQQKEAFLSIASHELKTPATALKSALQLLNEIKHNPYSEMHIMLIEQAGKSMDKMIRLINNLLDTKQIADSQLSIHKTKFIMGELVRTSCAPLAVLAKQELIVTGDIDATVVADENRIEQVLVNLVNNCVKYAADQKKIFVDIASGEKEIIVRVRDTGAGIPAVHVPFLFERYYRSHSNSGDNQRSGLGLGLHISNEIIRRHGGVMGVSSKEGEGAVFWFSLPHNLT